VTALPCTASQSRLQGVEPWLDAVFPIATALFCLRQRLLAHSLLTVYLLVRLLIQRNAMPWRWILISLLIVNAGLIIEDRDIRPGGSSDYLIIALSFAAGLQKSDQQWQRSLIWMASCIAPLLAFSLQAGDRLLIANSSFMGFNINKIGFLAGLLTVIAYDLLRQARTPLARAGASLLIAAGVSEALLSQSRAAIAVPLVVISIDQLARLKWTARRSLVTVLTCLLIGSAAVHTWYGGFRIKGNTLSDLNRFATTRCWLTSTIDSREGMFFGLGYGKPAQQFCGPKTIPSLKVMDRAKGLSHAHNLYAQLFAETGIAGLVLSLVLTWLALRRAWHLQTTGQRPVAFPLILYLVLMALGITFWQVLMLNQVLIGYSLALLSAAQPDRASADGSIPAALPGAAKAQG
jgi:hypothetical protein